MTTPNQRSETLSQRKQHNLTSQPSMTFLFIIVYLIASLKP